MNLRDIEYVVKIAEEQNLTRAAEKLFVTPSALTQHLSHLEKEIGTPLFFRSRNGWTPTVAGKIYLKTAQEMLYMQRETYKQLQDVVTPERGFCPSDSRRNGASPCSPASIPPSIRPIPTSRSMYGR